MNTHSANIPGTTADSSAPRAAVLIAAVLAGIGVLAGIATAVIGNMAGLRAIYYVFVLLLFTIGGLVTLTRREPLRFAFLALLVCLPIAAAQIPPGRLELTLFHAAMVVLTIGMIGKKLSGSTTAFEPLFPTKALSLAALLIIPCIVFSQYPVWSAQVFTFENLTIYVFLLFVLEELKRERGFERLVLVLSIVLIVMAIGLYIDHFLHINLSLRGSNLNQLTFSASRMPIYRAGGFFQDPQKAGAYLGCMITFLLLLSVRGRFRGMPMRYCVWGAIALSSGALLTTISRSALLASVAVSTMALFLFNKWNAAVKVVILAGVMVFAVSIAVTPKEVWVNILPTAVASRLVNLNEDFDTRRKIWFDTWYMFADHPLTGIGFGSFRRYLIETQPTVLDHYGL